MDATINRRLTEAARTLLTDPGMLAEFRRDPGVAVQAFELTGAEVEALKSGDAAGLAALGADVDEIQGALDGRRRRGRALRRMGRYAPRLAATVLATAVWFTPMALGPGRARARERTWRTSGARARMRYARASRATMRYARASGTSRARVHAVAGAGVAGAPFYLA